MTNFYFIEPEVAGSLGIRTRVNRSVHPPELETLHYEFDGWLGDPLLESFPAFVITDEAGQSLVQSELTGFLLRDAEITRSPQFDELYPKRLLPRFIWLKPVGSPGIDDFGRASDGRLVISERALNLLRTFGARHAVVEEFSK